MNVTTIALIRRSAALDLLVPLSQQIHFMNILGDDEAPYESMYSLVNGGLRPYFDAFVGARGGGKDSDNKMGEFYRQTVGLTAAHTHSQVSQ